MSDPQDTSMSQSHAASASMSLERRPQFGEPAWMAQAPGTITLNILTARDQSSPAVIRVGAAETAPAGLPFPEGQPSDGWTLHPIRVAQAGPFGRSGLCREGEANFVLQRKADDGSVTLIGVTAPSAAAITAESLCTVLRFRA